MSTTTPSGQHIQVTLERVSEGGTRHSAHFSRAAPDSQPMAAAERGRKQRAVASLFPEKQAALRAKDSSRKRERSATAQEQEEEDVNDQFDTMRQPEIEVFESEEEEPQRTT